MHRESVKSSSRECNLPRGWRAGVILASRFLLLLAARGTGSANAAEPEGLIAHWKCDEVSGAIAADSSGNGHTGAVVGAVFTPGRTNNALSLNGAGQYVYATDAASGGTTGRGLDMGVRSWTVSAWVQTTNSGMVITKMGYFGGASPDGWGVSVSGNGTLGAHIRKLGAGEVNIFSGDGARVNDGRWHHIAVVFDRASSLMRYVDGGLSGASSGLSFLMGQSLDNTQQVRLGARDQAGDEIYFRGMLDDVRVYDGALSAPEIAALAGLPRPPDPKPAWSAASTLVSSHGRVAVGNRVHVVGHTSGNLVHRFSQDNGATWSTPAVIAPAAGNYPMQYGGLFARGDDVFLITAAGDMGGTSQPLDFRKSTNNGAIWSRPVRITAPGQEIRRANIAASGNMVHVFGGQSGTGGYGTGIFYFRSTNGGVTWAPGKLLFANSDASARMAVDDQTVHVAFGEKLSPNSFGGRTHYIRSTDEGATWSEPVFIGEISAVSDVQARQQIAAADGRVVVMWQRERPFAGGALPADRLGYNRSLDGGVTWVGPALLPGDTGINREHHQIWMVPGGGVHAAWSHGPPSDSASPTGYRFSPDYGATWNATEIAISTPGGNLPHGIVADASWVHIIAEPGAGTYARRPASPSAPAFTSIRHEGENVRLEWRGAGILQFATNVTGPWIDIDNANTPHVVPIDSAQRFFRLVTPRSAP